MEHSVTIVTLLNWTRFRIWNSKSSHVKLYELSHGIIVCFTLMEKRTASVYYAAQTFCSAFKSGIQIHGGRRTIEMHSIHQFLWDLCFTFLLFFFFVYVECISQIEKKIFSIKRHSMYISRKIIIIKNIY